MVLYMRFTLFLLWSTSLHASGTSSRNSWDTFQDYANHDRTRGPPPVYSNPPRYSVLYPTPVGRDPLRVPVNMRPAAPVDAVSVPVTVSRTGSHLFRLSKNFLVQGRINGNSIGRYQINLGISFIWDRFSEDIHSSLGVLSRPIRITNSNGGSEALIHFASNQKFELGDFQISSVEILVSEKYYHRGVNHSMGQVGFGKGSRFTVPAAIFKGRDGHMGITFNVNGIDAYCSEGSNLVPLQLSDGNGDKWVIPGRVAVGDQRLLYQSHRKSIQIESVIDYVELDEYTGDKFMDLVGNNGLGCYVDVEALYMRIDECSCEDLIARAPGIRYDLTGGGRISVLPKTYIESVAQGSQCIARVKIQRDSDVLVVGRPFLESAVTLMDTPFRNNPKLTVCQSKF